MNQEIGRRGGLSANPNADSVRKIIEDACKVAATSVAIEERLGEAEESQPTPRVMSILPITAKSRCRI